MDEVPIADQNLEDNNFETGLIMKNLYLSPLGISFHIILHHKLSSQTIFFCTTKTFRKLQLMLDIRREFNADWLIADGVYFHKVV